MAVYLCLSFVNYNIKICQLGEYYLLSKCNPKFLQNLISCSYHSLKQLFLISFLLYGISPIFEFCHALVSNEGKENMRRSIYSNPWAQKCITLFLLTFQWWEWVMWLCWCKGDWKKKMESLSGELLHNDSSGLGKEHSTPFDGELWVFISATRKVTIVSALISWKTKPELSIQASFWRHESRTQRVQGKGREAGNDAK